MISVFTISHDTQYLDDAYESLLQQTYENWEWVVLLNGNAADLPIWEIEDSRVHIYRTNKGAGNIGWLKGEAVSHCDGAIILELDHDDTLIPTALEEVHGAFIDYPEASFVYSDTIRVNDNGTPNLELFDASHGWSTYAVNGYLAHHSFEPHPHNVAYIWYAPNHLRAFTRDAYDLAGGYSDKPVLDDGDLMCRLFIQGRFVHINKPLYKQRIHAHNTQSIPEINTQIQKDTVDVYNQYIEQMCVAWSKRRGLLCLDLGAAHNPAPGFDGVDLNEGKGVKYVGDFLTLDLPPKSVGVIRANDFLEHIADKRAVMEKIYTLLADGGMLLSNTPSSGGRGAFQDPTHVSYWNPNSFWYYTNQFYWDFAPSNTKFQQSFCSEYFPSEWHAQHDILYVRANLIALRDDVHKYGGHRLW